MKKLMFTLAIVSLSSVAFAQQGSGTSSSYPVMVEESAEMMVVPTEKYKVETNRFFDNWFISFGGGAQVLFDDYGDKMDFKKRISPTFNVAIGKWFTPGLGLRLQLSGIQVKSYAISENTPYIKGAEQPNGYYEQKFNYLNLHGDILFNVSGMLGGYNPDRVYDFIPYTGFGYNRVLDKPHSRTLAVNFGIINRFRISSAWDINLELSGMVTEDRFDGKVTGKAADMTIGASLGFAYNFPQRGFKHVPDVNAIMALTASQMDAINAALAEQMEENKRLKNQLANQRPVEVVNEKVVVKEVPAAPQSVFFQIGSYVLPPHSEVNLKAIAEMMKNNPNMTLAVTGYADSDTGSAALNKQLSENRANAVADALAKLGVSKDRMVITGKGGVNTLTPPSFNRRVILEAQ